MEYTSAITRYTYNWMNTHGVSPRNDLHKLNYKRGKQNHVLITHKTRQRPEIHLFFSLNRFHADNHVPTLFHHWIGEATNKQLPRWVFHTPPSVPHLHVANFSPTNFHSRLFWACRLLSLPQHMMQQYSMAVFWCSFIVTSVRTLLENSGHFTGWL